jgi:hypothetical protein
MRLGADSANAIRQKRHFLDRTPNHESFKAAQFRDLEIGICYIPVVIQEDFDLAVAFQTGNGINANSLCHKYLP